MRIAICPASGSDQASGRLIAKWQLVGFIHGVMNTDNMAISGETIDYGPCAFMDAYDPATVFSSIDRQGRYAYGNQPILAGGISRDLLKPYCRCCMKMRRGAQIGPGCDFRFYRLVSPHWLTGMRANWEYLMKRHRMNP